MDMIVFLNVKPEDHENFKLALEKVSIDTEADIIVKADGLKKQKKAEYDKQRYESKKNSTVKTVNEIKEEREEKEEVLPPSPPLPFSPLTPYPITPYNPPLPEEKEEREEKLLAVSTAESENRIDWQRAFGPRAEMARHFWMASGIAPIKSEFSHWQRDLKELEEAGITIRQMENAVDKMKLDKLTIKSPKSVLAVARSMASPQITDPKKMTYHDMAEELRAHGILGEEKNLLEMAGLE